jgi:hypothetical protein
MPDKRYTKVEEEIIQILDRLESEEPAPTRPPLRIVSPRPKRSRRFQSVHVPRPKFDTRPAWFWLAASFTLAAAAYFVRDFSSTLAMLLAIASICAFFAPLFSRGPGVTPAPGPPATKRWRGKDISFDTSSHEGRGDRARRWLHDRRGGPRRLK